MVISKRDGNSLPALSGRHFASQNKENHMNRAGRYVDNLRVMFDYIKQYPIIDIKRTAKELDISYNTVATAVKKLVELGILQETSRNSQQ